MSGTKFNTFNIIIVILIILAAAAAVGIATYGLKESSSVTPSSNQSQTSANPAQPTSSSVITEVVWPTSQEIGAETTQTPNQTPFSFAESQLSGSDGNQVADAYLSAYQEVQKNKDSYKEVNFNATVYQYLPLRDFLNGLGIRIDSSIYEILDQADYRAVFCYRDANNIDKGFRFNIAQPTYEQSYYEELYSTIDGKLKKWEPTISIDFKSVFYGGSELSKTGPIFQNAEYDKIPFRYATVKDQKGNDLSIAYAFFEGSFLVANNIDCLKSMLKAAEPEADAQSQGKTWGKK
jgi:hypothetical protein